MYNFLNARKRKEQIWMAGQQVHGDAATIQRLLTIVVDRINASQGSVPDSTLRRR